MHQKERLRSIQAILEKNGFVTVKHLKRELHYSPATINRDLNLMQNQGIIKRSFGGAELAEDRTVPLYFRYNKMRPAKNKIGKLAASFIENGDTIFIDCSTTAQYIGKYITDRSDLTVITNNLYLAAFLSEHHIRSICLGGTIMEPPSMIYSSETVEMVQKLGADKLFFSACAITPDGKIGHGEYDAHTMMIKAMMKNAKEKYLMLDHEKLTDHRTKYLDTLDAVDTVITDFEFSEKTKQQYKNTKFLTTI